MSRARDLSNLANQNALSVDSSSFDVGISSSSPDSDLNVGGTIKMDGPSGVITATSYEGSGANLTGIAATDTIAAASLTVSGISTLTGVVKGLSDVRVTGNLNAGITTLGAVTVTSITGDGSGLTGVANTDVVHTREVTVSGVSTFTGDVSLGSSITSKGTSGKGGLFGHLEVGLDTKYVTIQPTGVDANRELHLNYDRGELKIAQNQVTGGGSTITAYADVHLGIGHSINFNNTQKAFITGHSVGVGTTTTAGLAGIAGTATGTIAYDTDKAQLQVYTGSAWLQVSNANTWEVSSPAPSSGPAQTGVVKYTEGDSVYAVFYDPGTVSISGNISAEGALLVGGGGTGGAPGGGAGGAGGVLADYNPFPLSDGTYDVTVGDGAPPIIPSSPANPEGPASGNVPWLNPTGPQWPTSVGTGMVGTPGQPSVFGTHTAYGGENGGASNANPTYPNVAAYPNPTQQCSFHFPAGGAGYVPWSPAANCGSGGSLQYSDPGPISPLQPQATTQQPSAPFTGYGNKGGEPAGSGGGNAGSGGAGGEGADGQGGNGGLDLLLPTAWWPDSFSSSPTHFPSVCLNVPIGSPVDERRAFAGGGSSYNNGAGSPYGTGGSGGPAGPQGDHSGTNFRGGAGGAMNTPNPGATYSYGGKGVFIIKLPKDDEK